MMAKTMRTIEPSGMRDNPGSHSITEMSTAPRQRYVGDSSFPPIKDLADLIGPLDPLSRDYVDQWHSLSPELQAMVPYVGQLIAEGMGGAALWDGMSTAERNIMGYTATALLARAWEMAQHQVVRDA